MSDSTHGRANVGAYDKPFSGVGIEYYPLGINPGRSGLTLHESGYLSANSDWNFPSVFSPFWRLNYNAEAGHCVVFGDKMIELTPDHLVLIPDHHLFHCLGQQPVPTWWQAFSFTRQLYRGISIPIVLPVRDVELCLMEELQKLISVNATWEPTDAIYRTSLALLHVVLARPELIWQPPVPDVLQRVHAFINAHIGEKMSNSLLAREAAMSVTGFERAFKRHFGTTPAQYVTDVRVREASRLLLQTRESIETIAESTGFPDRDYFSRVFKKVTGEAPAGFRRKHCIL